MSASRSGERVGGGGVPGTLGEEQELLGESLMGACTLGTLKLRGRIYFFLALTYRVFVYPAWCSPEESGSTPQEQSWSRARRRVTVE